MEKFDYQVDEDTVTQSTLLHSDIPEYDLPSINLCHHQKKHKKATYSKEQDVKIFTLRKGTHT